MGAFEYQKSTHAIGEAVFTFTANAPVHGDPVTRTLTVGSDDEQVTVRFTHDDFELFKAIVREY